MTLKLLVDLHCKRPLTLFVFAVCCYEFCDL
uniref:Uncharacterized protein n=1 Tax=Rhizophora mucronata TaxID=61149 RepID=A0A2P2PNG9_RHIMU